MDLKGFFSNHIQNIRFSWRRIWTVVIVVFIIVVLFFAGAMVYANSYTNKVYPGVYIGDIHIGGMDREDLQQYMQQMQSKMISQGIFIEFLVDGEKKQFTVYPHVITDENLRDLIMLDIPQQVDTLITYRKNNTTIADALTAVWVRVSKPHVPLQHVTVDKEGVLEEIKLLVADYISEPVQANVKISSIEPLRYTITSSTQGISFDYEHVAGQIVSQWSRFESPRIEISTFVKEPEVKESDVETIISRLPSIFKHGRLDINYIDPHTRREFLWFVSIEEMASWIEVQKFENNIVFGLNKELVDSFLADDVNKQINVEAQDAKFSIGQNGRVTEFLGSRPGIGVDESATYEAINTAIVDRTLHDEGITKAVTLLIKQVEPKINTGEVNNLGITEILGVGHSKFRGSPSNRIKNIRHAAFDKLHGLLIKPGEEFSLVQALQPFTIEDGYLPELVIKGDRVIPELGGGLCQIGTTMFRAAMNSGLPITERRNHSLVVPYYNDLSNGNPGTDATIYEPHPDFRFRNDTGNYILIASEMSLDTADLYFYFWGTSDGRKGSFSPPQVSKWIPTGPTQEIETTELEPGVRNCQDRHVGAVASFTYTRFLSDGEKVDQVFESYYRPLPQICLVGVEKLSEIPACAEGENCEISTPDAPGTSVGDHGFDPSEDIFGPSGDDTTSAPST